MKCQDGFVAGRMQTPKMRFSKFPVAMELNQSPPPSTCLQPKLVTTRGAESDQENMNDKLKPVDAIIHN